MGFGMGMMLSPMLLLVLDPPPVVLAVNTLILCGASDDRGEREGRGGRRVGQAAGDCRAGRSPCRNTGTWKTWLQESLKILIGVVIVVLAALSLSRRRIPIPKSKLVDAAFGFGGAALVTGLGVGIPIVAWHLFNQGLGARKIRVTIAVYYSTVAVFAIVLYVIFGIYTGERWLLNLMLLPATLAGFWVASRLVGRMKESMLRFAVVAVIIISGLTLLIRELVERYS